MLHDVKHLIIGRLAFWLGAVVIVLPITAGQSALAQGRDNGNTITQTSPLIPVDMDPTDDIDLEENAGGMVTLHRRPANNTMSWELKAAGLNAGHAYTVWVGNWLDEEGNFDDSEGGWGAGGLMGGDGRVTAAGNHCIWLLVTFDTGGFRPGDSPECAEIDVEKPIIFFVLDHREWEPGDMMHRWDPTGGTGDISTVAGFLEGHFGPLED